MWKKKKLSDDKIITNLRNKTDREIESQNKQEEIRGAIEKTADFSHLTYEKKTISFYKTMLKRFRDGR